MVELINTETVAMSKINTKLTLVGKVKVADFPERGRLTQTTTTDLMGNKFAKGGRYGTPLAEKKA